MILSSLLELAAFGSSVLFRFLQLLRQKLDVSPDDREWIAKIVDKFGRSLAERGESLLLRQFLEEAIVQFLDFTGRVFARAMEPRALDIASDHLAHFARIKWLADVVVRAEAKRFLGRFERAESGQHDDGKMRIDFANPAQAFDAGHAGHSNVHDDRVGFFLLSSLIPASTRSAV